MTKTRTSRFISMFLCVCMAVLCIQGLSFRAAADAQTYTVTISANGNSKTIENVTLPRTFRCDYMNENGELDLIIKELYGIDTRGFCHPSYVPSSDNPSVTAGLDGMSHYFTITSEFAGSATISGTYKKWGADPFEYSLSVSLESEAHTHNYAFSANGDTITVNCDKAGCTEPPYTASITLIPPTLTTEGGEGSPEATLLFTGIDEDLLAYWNCTMEDLVAVAQNAIVYYNGDEKLDEAPTEAGDYTAKLTIYADGEYTATIPYTIAEAKSEEEPEPAPAPSAPIAVTGTAKAASGGAPGLVSGTSGSLEMLTWNAQLDGKTLTWEAKDGADGFVISIRAKGAKAFKRFDRVTEKSADISRLKPGTYTIYVRYEKDGKLAKCRQSARTTIKIK